MVYTLEERVSHLPLSRGPTPMNVPLQYHAVTKRHAALAPVPSALELVRERVRVEKQKLDVKYQVLCEFLDDPNNFNKVDSFESGLLYNQREAMKFYREALAARIAHWDAGGKSG